MRRVECSSSLGPTSWSYSPECVEETVRKGRYRRSERGFGRYTEAKMVRKELFR
jgi:hypothetical protein